MPDSPTTGQVLSYTTSPINSLVWASVPPLTSYSTYESSFIHGSGGSFSSGQPRILTVLDTAIASKGPSGNITVDTFITGSSDERYTWFRNTSGEDRVWNIKARVFIGTVGTSPGDVSQVEIWANIATDLGNFSGDVTASNGGASTVIPNGEFRGYREYSDIPGASTFITFDTTILVPDFHYVTVIANATFVNGTSWIMGSASPRQTSIAITEQPI